MPEENINNSEFHKLIENVARLAEASDNQKQDTQLILNEIKDLRNGLSDLQGWRKYIVGVSVGISAVVSTAIVIIGFFIKFSAFPISAHPMQEAEAAGKPLINIVESGKLDVVDASLPVMEDNEEEEEKE